MIPYAFILFTKQNSWIKSAIELLNDSESLRTKEKARCDQNLYEIILAQ